MKKKKNFLNYNHKTIVLLKQTDKNNDKHIQTRSTHTNNLSMWNAAN